MKKICIILFLFLMALRWETTAQNKWIEDQEMGFKIAVPSNYQTNQFREGNDKIHAFVSPDQNVAVRVRSFKVDINVTNEQILQLFSQNIINGAQQLVGQTHQLNGLDGQIAGYRWIYNNIKVIVGVFCTMQNNTAYIVWTLIPENLFQQRNSESDAITNSFSILPIKVQHEISSNQQINNQTATPDLIQQIPTDQNKPQSANVQSIGYTTLVSDDACIEHLIPEKATMRSAEKGQKVWDIPIDSYGTKITLVIQNILKQGKDFNSFINGQISNLKTSGASVRSQDFGITNGMSVCNYWYEYNGTMFKYTAVDGPFSFYMLGFVGGLNYEDEVGKHHSTIQTSFKKASCANIPDKQQAIQIFNQSVNMNTSQENNNIITQQSQTSNYEQVEQFIISSNDANMVKITSLETGTSINSDINIIDDGNSFPPSTEKIHLVFDYQGNTNGQNFEVKWFSKTHNCMIIEDSYLPKVNGLNRVHSFIQNDGKLWPSGDYYTKVWLGTKKLSETNFTIAAEQTKDNYTQGKLLGKCYSDGKGNNQTKSLGGKYYSLDLNTVNDNDVFELRITSGTLKFVHIHFRSSIGAWHTAYHGINTKFKVGDLLAGKRSMYTHFTINVNAEHEKYLPEACYAEIWLLPPGQSPPMANQKPQNPTTNEVKSTFSGGSVKQIILDNQNNAYDFASGKLGNIKQLPDPDVMNEPWCTNLPALCGNWAKTGKSSMAEVTSAPASGYISDGLSYVDCKECPVNEVLVFKLKNGDYAKLIVVKDDYTKTGNGCQHRITCQVEYPAFTAAQASSGKNPGNIINSGSSNLTGFWPHSARLTKAEPNNPKPIDGFKMFYQYGEFSIQVPNNWESQSQSGRTMWYSPVTDGGIISHLKLNSDANFEKLKNTSSTNQLKNLGIKNIGGFETCLHQTKQSVGMQNNILMRTDVIYIKTSRGIHMITFHARETMFNDFLEPYAVGVLNSLIKN